MSFEEGLNNDVHQEGLRKASKESARVPRIVVSNVLILPIDKYFLNSACTQNFETILP